MVHLPPDRDGCDVGRDISLLRGLSSLLCTLGVSDALDSPGFNADVSGRCDL